MSSLVALKERIQRGKLSNFEDLPIKIKELVNDIYVKFNLTEIYIYGSYLFGNYADDSDIDLLVDTSEIKNIDFIRKIKEYILEKYSMKSCIYFIPEDKTNLEIKLLKIK